MDRRSKHLALGCVLALSVAFAIPGCKKKSSDSAASEEPVEEVLLEGRFRKVTKEATGIVQIRRRAGDYELVLRGVTVHAKPPIHVYVVGLPEARSTAAVDGTDSKYDMGSLEEGTTEQIIAIPKPLDELRSVVLWNPAFGVNLASASLEPPPE